MLFETLTFAGLCAVMVIAGAATAWASNYLGGIDPPDRHGTRSPVGYVIAFIVMPYAVIPLIYAGVLKTLVWLITRRPDGQQARAYESSRPKAADESRHQPYAAGPVTLTCGIGSCQYAVYTPNADSAQRILDSHRAERH